MEKQNYCVQGMHCKTCEVYIESQFKDIKGVSDIKTDSEKQTLSFTVREGFNSEKIVEEINKKIKDSGYKIDKKIKKESSDNSNIPLAFTIALFIIFLFGGLQRIGIGESLFSAELTLPMVFVLGLIASVSSCMAIVGALVLSFSSLIAKKEHFKSSMTIFHISRLISFFILGGVLGVLGSLILLTPDIQLIVNIFLFVVMVLLSLDMLNIFPISSITLPKGISQRIFNTKKVGYIFTPVLFGLATFFLPCGFTQSMQIQSILAGDFLQGALTMLMFALGTLPVLIAISFSSKIFTKSSWKDLFFKVSGFLVLFFAIYNLYGALVANGIIEPII